MSTLPNQAPNVGAHVEKEKGFESDPEKQSVHSSAEAVDVNRGIDVSAQLMAGRTDEPEVEDEEFRRIRAKLDWRIMPLLCALYCLQSIDKSTLGASAVLGIRADNNLTQDDFNNLGSAFYVGYLIFVWPQNWALQRLPVAKWLSINIYLWALLLGLHAVCNNFGGLFVLRLLLGGSESSITAGLMLVTSMFYTRKEITQRIAWSFQCNGIASIISGFLSYGVAHVNSTQKPAQWQWLMVITSILSFVCATLWLFFFPDNPTSARFLTEEEKVRVVKRIESNQTGIETKTFKKAQLWEALRDPKTWMFFFFACISNLQSGTGTQYTIIISDLGFDYLMTTLLSIPLGFCTVISVTTATIVLQYYPNSRSWISMTSFLLSTFAGALLVGLPADKKYGLLVSFYLLGLSTAGFVMVLGWIPCVVSGHTKKLACNALFLIGYSVGQILATQFWKQQYRPRNIVPWSIVMTTYALDILMVYGIRLYLQAENRRRDRELEASGKPYEKYGIIEVPNPEKPGEMIKQKVDINLLDLTDWENPAFRYVL
jgi:hypothetical protein